MWTARTMLLAGFRVNHVVLLPLPKCAAKRGLLIGRGATVIGIAQHTQKRSVRPPPPASPGT